METIGAKLKKVRLEKGLTLEEVHKQTKIHLNVLKAIEEESLVNFSPVYIKGFLKIYCNFLGINPSDYITKEKQIQAPLKTVSEEKKPGLPPIKILPLDPGLFKYIRSKIKPVILIIVVLVVVIGLFNLGKFIFLKASHLSRKSVLPASVVMPKQTRKKEVAKLQKSKRPVSIPKSQQQEQTVFSGITLGIRAKEDCWMQVKSDGKVIFQNILRKGRFENWRAKEKIEFCLGNAGVVELEVNGKIIPALGRRGQTVKNILLTKDGLSTSR